jgi:hypothetical protein
MSVYQISWFWAQGAGKRRPSPCRAAAPVFDLPATPWSA